MARKLKINYVKCRVESGSNNMIVKVRVLRDISPDSWDMTESRPDIKLYYKAEADPEIGEDTPIQAPYKTKLSSAGKYMYQWFRITGCTVGLSYHIFAAGTGEETGKTYKSAITIERFSIPTQGNPVLMVYGYNGWVDFSDCVTVPDYKVNNTNITDEWTDGNHNLHSAVTQTRIKGSFNLWFQTKSRLNQFLACLRWNEQEYGTGRLRLKVQVNNELDLDDMDNYNPSAIETAQPATYNDLFKIDWDPDWALPFFGTNNDHNAISMEIEEIED